MEVEGVIIPPPEIRAIVNKTAQFVARNGKEFEERILNSGEGKTAKFDFMKGTSPYHAYYEERISKYEKGDEDEEEGPKAEHGGEGEDDEEVEVEVDETAPQEQDTTVKASKVSCIERFAMSALESERPEDLIFVTAHPDYATPLDVDIIKLTARYSAIRGQDFLLGLAEREVNNPQFMFLQPTHPHFNYFTHLVDCYARALAAVTTDEEEWTGGPVRRRGTRMGALASAVQRWTYRMADEEAARLAAASDEDKIAAMAIDWHDFTVVETIDFDEEERQLSERMDTEGSRGEKGGQEIGHIDNGSSSQEENHGRNGDSDGDGGNDDDDGDNDDDDDDDDDDGIKIIKEKDYNSAKTSAPTLVADYTMKDPVSGRAVPVSEMSEHMRIQLIDPKWSQQQKKFQEKQADTGFAAGASIAASLKQFALRRGEMGSTVVSQTSAAPSSSSSSEGHASKIMRSQE